MDRYGVGGHSLLPSLFLCLSAIDLVLVSLCLLKDAIPTAQVTPEFLLCVQSDSVSAVHPESQTAPLNPQIDSRQKIETFYKM